MSPYYDFTPQITSAGIPDPFVPVDGNWNVTGAITATGDITGDNLIATGDVSAGGSITGSGLLVDDIAVNSLTASNPSGIRNEGDLDFANTKFIKADGTNIAQVWNTQFAFYKTIAAGANNDVDIGTNAVRFKDLYLSGTIDAVGVINTDEHFNVAQANQSLLQTQNTDVVSRPGGNTPTISIASASYWENIDFHTAGTIAFSVNAAKLANFYGNVATSGDIDAQGSITGSGILCDTLNAGVSTATDLTVNSLTASNSVGISPAVDNASDVGTSTLRFKDLYLSGNINVPAEGRLDFSPTADTIYIGTAAGGLDFHAGGGRPLALFGGVIQPLVNIVPQLNNTVDLGSDTTRFKDLFLSGNAVIDGDVDVEGSITGSSIYSEGNIFIGNGKFIGAAGEPTIQLFTTQIGIYKNIAVSADNTWDLGTNALRFKDLYLSGNLNMSGNGQLLIPTGSNTLSAPGLAFPGDENTGITKVGSNVYFGVDGVEAFHYGSIVVFAKDIWPVANDTITLGDVDYKFKALHVSSASLGSGSAAWPAIGIGGYGSGNGFWMPNDNNLRLSMAGGNTVADFNTTGIITSRNLVPSVTNALNVGSPSYAFKNVIASGSYFAGGAPLTAYGSIVTNDDGSAPTATIDATPRPLLTYDNVGMSKFMTGSVGASHHGLTVDYNGVYEVRFNMSFTGTGNGKAWDFHVYSGPSGSTSFKFTSLSTQRKIGTGGDIGSCGFGGIVPLTASDLVEVWAECTDEQTISVHASALTLRMVDDWPA